MFASVTVATSILAALATFGSAEASLTPRNSQQCQNNYFWYDRLSCCLKNGGESSSAPSGSSCPSNFYWHNTENCCVPKSSDATQQMPSSCPNGYAWNTLTWSCRSTAVPTTTTCGTGFWWSALNMCVSLGNTNANVPSGYSCPDNWSWLSSKSCCKPNTPTSTTPTCGSSWSWHPGKQCCVPGGSGATPSNVPGTHSRKRQAAVHKRTTFCPSTHESCIIPGSSKRAPEYECLDTRSELTSCGGCTATGHGQDCSAIQNAKVSTCQAGKCVVQKCKNGFEVDVTGGACVSELRVLL